LNPIATIASASMMLRYALGEIKAAEKIDNAIKKALSEGYRTQDLASFDAKEICSTKMGGKLLMQHHLFIIRHLQCVIHPFGYQ